jgi:DNA-binding beta-propeller fold protein YncE
MLIQTLAFAIWLHAAPTPAPARGDTLPPARLDTTTTASRDSLPFVLASRDTLALIGAGRDRVLEPSGIAVDPFGTIYMTDVAGHRLQRFNALGTWLGESGALGSDVGQMRRPVGVAPLGSLGVAVLDRENRRLLSYDLFGRLLGVLVDLAAPDLEERIGRTDPVALAADRGGAVVLADADRDRLLAFDFSGRFVREIGGYGTRPGSFRGLAGVAVAPRGEWVTTERGNARVQRLDAGGRVASAWPLPIGKGATALPVAVDDSARVAVGDEAGGRAWVFDSKGRLLARREGLAGPRALAFAPDGALLVVEGRGGRVVRFVLEKQRAPAPAATGR